MTKSASSSQPQSESSPLLSPEQIAQLKSALIKFFLVVIAVITSVVIDAITDFGEPNPGPSPIATPVPTTIAQLLPVPQEAQFAAPVPQPDTCPTITLTEAQLQAILEQALQATCSPQRE